MNGEKSSNKELKDKELSKKSSSSSLGTVIESMIENAFMEILIFLQKALPSQLAIGLIQDYYVRENMFNSVFIYFRQNYINIFTKNNDFVNKSFSVDKEKTKVKLGEIEREERANFERENGQGQELNASFFTEDIPNHFIVKCLIKDNIIKPRTVSDLSLAINLPASVLLPPILLYQATVEYLFKNILTKYYIDVLKEEIKTIDAKKKSGSGANSHVIYIERLNEKMEQLAEELIDFDASFFPPKYSIFFDVLIESINQLDGKGVLEDCDQQLRNMEKIDLENLRDENFSIVAKRLSSIMDSSNLGYQYIENIKRERVLILKEYEDEDELSLPDEKYQMQLNYYTQDALANIRKTYRNKVFSSANKADHLLGIVDSKLYGDAYSLIINSIEDLKENYKKYLQECSDLSCNSEEDSFLCSSYISAKDDKTFTKIKNDIRKNFNIIQQRISEIYGQRYPADRHVLEDRLSSLKKELEALDSLVNPFYLDSGFVLDVIATSIKRKRTTFTALRNAIATWLGTFEMPEKIERGQIEKKVVKQVTIKKKPIIRDLIQKEALKDTNTSIEETNKERKVEEEIKAENVEIMQKRKRGRPRKIESTEAQEIKKESLGITKEEVVQKRKRGRPRKEESGIIIKKKNKNLKQKNLFKEI